MEQIQKIPGLRLRSRTAQPPKSRLGNVLDGVLVIDPENGIQNTVQCG
jgi:hypothetical protein